MRGTGPDVSCDFDSIWIVVAASGYRPEFRPALESQPDRGAAGWTDVHEDRLAAAVGGVFEPLQLAAIELDRFKREQRLGIEGRARHSLAERAVAGQRAQRLLACAEPDSFA